MNKYIIAHSGNINVESSDILYIYVGQKGSDGSGGTDGVSGSFGGGATEAVNVGAGVNISLDKLAKSFAGATGTTVPDYFKLPIEFSVGWHFQVGLDNLLFSHIGEDLGIDDGGLTYSVGLKW